MVYNKSKGVLYLFSMSLFPKNTSEERSDGIMKISLFKDKRLKAAIMKNNLEMVSKLLKEDSCDDIMIDEKPALIYAIEKGYFDISLKLIEANADVSQTDDDNYSPLHYAFINETTPLRVIKSLVEHGANVNAVSSIGRTPLHIACINGNLHAMKYLISVGADLHRTDMFGNTLMHIACMNNYTDIVKYLISSELNLYQENNNDIQAVDLLEDSKRQKLLYSIRFKDKKKMQDDLGITKNSIKIPMRKESLKVAEHDFTLDNSRNKIFELLFIACKKGNVEYARHLIDMGADIRTTDMLGNNLLMNMACKNNDINMIRLLMKNGLSMFESNYLGQSPADLLSPKMREKLAVENVYNRSIDDNDAFQSISRIKTSPTMQNKKPRIISRSISLVNFKSKDTHSKYFQL